jgi:hypothetical protein
MCESCNSFPELCNASNNPTAHLCSVKNYYKQKKLIMENLLYLIAVLLIIAWAIGFFAFQAGGIIHILLVIAVIAIILRIIRGGRVL